MVSIARKMIRAIFVGMTIGLLGGLGVFMEATGVNLTAGGTEIFNPIGLFVIVFGGTIVASIAIELSGDIAADNNKSSAPKT